MRYIGEVIKEYFGEGNTIDVVRIEIEKLEPFMLHNVVANYGSKFNFEIRENQLFIYKIRA